MNHDSWFTDEPRSARITGSALVITRLSRVAMNIGSEAATTASQTGTRREVARRPSTAPAEVSGASARTSRVVDILDLRSRRHWMITSARDASNQLITCQA